jgi:3-oxosteroid 1-dehydrogenase
MRMGEAAETYDFIIVGSGAGSIPAALMMQQAGKRPLILEKQYMIGGTSAYSGGMLWVPDNDFMKAAGQTDSQEKARRYMDAVIGEPTPSSTPERRDAYVRGAPEMLRFMTERGLKYRFANLPDYFDELEGGMANGRAVVPRIFDVNALGEWRDRLGGHPLTQRYPTEGADAPEIAKGTMRGQLIKLKVGWRLAQNRLLGRNLRGFGNALMGQLFNLAFKAKIPLWTETEVKDFIVENGRVVGVVADRKGETIRLRSELGVLLNAGGFARSKEMREKYLPQPTSPDWSLVNATDTGDMIRKCIEIGAAVEQMDAAFWFPASFAPDGSVAGMHATQDMGKPGTILVGTDGKRFVNEAISHTDVGNRMYETGAVPAWAVFDERRRSKYPFGMVFPWASPEPAVRSGYIKRGQTIEDLAQQCGIDAAGLKETIARFNVFAKTGKDEDFHRGESAYQRDGGDPRVKPNPSLAPLDRAPYYAVPIYPSDVGTCGGVLTDESARVLNEERRPIPGLYACGNTTASVMGRGYPGGGVSLGPMMTFGYLAAKHAARMNQ